VYLAHVRLNEHLADARRVPEVPVNPKRRMISEEINETLNDPCFPLSRIDLTRFRNSHEIPLEKRTEGQPAPPFLPPRPGRRSAAEPLRAPSTPGMPFVEAS